MVPFDRLRARRAMRAWIASKRSAIGQIPRPSGPAQIHSDGVDADRVLVWGPGLAVGWGATSYADALPGAVARALSDLTDRGTDVDIIADPDLTVTDATAEIDSLRLWRFDLIVLTFGINEALDLTTPAVWARNLSTLLDRISDAALPSARVAVVSIEPVGSLAALDGPLAARADAVAVDLNSASQQVSATREHVTYVRLDAGSESYPAAAEQLADSMIDALTASRRESAGVMRGPAGHDATQRERERQEGVDQARIVDTPDEDRFDKIVTMARQLYGTSGAAFAVVDNNRVWHKSKSPELAREVPRDPSFCSTTILHRGPHVVADMLVEAAPSDSATADELGIRFYAGYPVEAPNGEQIGALCIFDERPRTDEEFDESMLRQLALLIQAEIRVQAVA